MNLLISWIALTLAFWVASLLLPGFKVKGGAINRLVVAAIFGTLSFFLSSALFVAIGIGTLGIGFLLSFLTRLIVSTLLLLVTDKLTSRLSVAGFGTAFIASLVMAIVGTVVEAFLHHFF
ncbi:MAG: phage holin family protein [Myxococcota bacterium]|nr:phage holin family protein [Myxococcota bacterium]